MLGWSRDERSYGMSSMDVLVWVTLKVNAVTKGVHGHVPTLSVTFMSGHLGNQSSRPVSIFSTKAKGPT